MPFQLNNTRVYDIQFYNISLYVICYHFEIKFLVLKNGYYVLCDTIIRISMAAICIFRKFYENVFFCSFFFGSTFCFICIFQFEWQQLYYSFYIFWTFLYLQVGRHYMSVVTFMWCWYGFQVIFRCGWLYCDFINLF